MNTNQLKIIYFSPTNTTKQITKSIAAGIESENVKIIDLTYEESGQKMLSFKPDDVVLLGSPVYGGRLPEIVIKRFRCLKAENSLAILVVLYGNREFEDALLELQNLAVELGFQPIAAGAFIGEHSFQTNDFPIASGRPDEQDIQKAKLFGQNINKKIANLSSINQLSKLKVPGEFPYKSKGAPKLNISPVSKEDICTLCGECSTVCPMKIISINDEVKTIAEQCIRCSACIKACPTGARSWKNSKMKEIINWLNTNCTDRKEPQIFGV